MCFLCITLNIYYPATSLWLKQIIRFPFLAYVNKHLAIYCGNNKLAHTGTHDDSPQG